MGEVIFHITEKVSPTPVGASACTAGCLDSASGFTDEP